MLSAEELLKQAQEFNKVKKYAEVIASLRDEWLDAYQNADLYAEKAHAHWRLKQYELCNENAQKALLINPKNSSALNSVGYVFWNQKEFDKAIECYEKALDIKPEFASPYNGLGNVYSDLKEYEKAIRFYNESIRNNPKYEHPYNGLGIVYTQLKDYTQAIEWFNKSIEIEAENLYAYNSLGNVYYDLKDYDKAIESYNKAIKVDSSFSPTYFNRARAYQILEKHEASLEDYSEYIILTKNNVDYFTQLAESRINELKILIKNIDHSDISNLTNKIKALLLFKGQFVTHYTSLSVGKSLILNGSPFRLSEGVFLNDTSEGKELFDFLPPLFRPAPKTSSSAAKPFMPKPFIGSFVTETKNDDLNLWRLYGKENKEEAQGCSITIDKDQLFEKLHDSLMPYQKTAASEQIDNVFSFYRVAYRNYEKQYFKIPDATAGEENIFNELMLELKYKIENILKKKDELLDPDDLVQLLNGVAYLFKSDEYQSEFELRFIVNGIGFDKIINTDISPPRVYIQLVEINPIVKKITLGPRFSKADEWASAFYYILEKQGTKAEILISHLPFK